MSDEECISLETVKYYLGEENLKKRDDTLGKFSSYPLNRAKEEFEKLYIEKNLEEFNHNISKTADMIGIYPSNLHRKIKRTDSNRTMKTLTPGRDKYLNM